MLPDGDSVNLLSGNKMFLKKQYSNSYNHAPPLVIDTWIHGSVFPTPFSNYKIKKQDYKNKNADRLHSQLLQKKRFGRTLLK